MINQKPNIQNLIICANVFIRKDGKYLLMKRSPEKKYAPNKIHPFGGKVDQNENPFDGAVREIKEDVGINIKNLKLEAVINELKPDNTRSENWLIFHFSADYDSGEVKTSEEGKIVYLTPEEIKSSDLFPSVKSIIDNILDPNSGTVFTTNSYHGFESEMKELSKNICAVK
jgi:8-oxo-dGTP diphosphatase